MTEQEFRKRLQELQGLLNRMIDGALAIGVLSDPQVQRSLLEMLQSEIVAFLQEVAGDRSG